MSSIHYLPDACTITVDSNETILQASLRSNIPHAHICGGKARCSTCRVLILEGLEHCASRGPKEQALAERLGFAPHIRLACQTTVSGDVRLRRLVLDAEDVSLTSQLDLDVSPDIVGQEQRIVVLFADIRGFTPFAERLLPYDVVHVLNRYFYHMGQAIRCNGGAIDNYMGDGLMALFGVHDFDDAAFRAVSAGLAMLAAMRPFNVYLERLFGASLQIGIGIHTGDAIVGAIGAKDQKRMTAIGDTVNMASRIEAANKAVATNLLISEATYAEIQSRVVVGKVVQVALPGKSGVHTLYEIGELRASALDSPLN